MRLFQKITLTLFLVIILVLGFALPLNPPAGNWYQQFLPNLNNRPLSDITFLDSLNGYAVTGDGTVGDTNYILKTTNRGDNWSIIYTIYRDLSRIIFLNQNTGFVCGGFNNVQGNYLIKTTDAGLNWTQINVPDGLHIVDMHILSSDTIWFMDEFINDNIYLTVNGGINWTLQYSSNNSLRKLYFYNYNIGFMCTSFNLFKTTNSGFNWTQIIGQDYFLDIYFIDSLTGWKARDTVKKTTDGGITWQAQPVPRGPNIAFGIFSISNVNKDTIWGVGGFFAFPNSQLRGMIYRTTNGGNNWFFQIPDTSYNIVAYGDVQFINKNIGWAYSNMRGIHTTNAGDTIWLTGLQQISSQIPQSYKLFQNYPNPFNPKTNIKYDVRSQTSNVRLTVFDITGKHVIDLVNQKQAPGTYEVDFSGIGYSSGVYFYSLIVDGVRIATKKMILVK